MSVVSGLIVPGFIMLYVTKIANVCYPDIPILVPDPDDRKR